MRRGLRGAHSFAELCLVTRRELLKVGVQVCGGDRSVIIVRMEWGLKQNVLLHRSCTAQQHVACALGTACLPMTHATPTPVFYGLMLRS